MKKITKTPHCIFGISKTKNLAFITMLLLTMVSAKAQTPWTTELLNIQESSEAKLGTESAMPLNFYTNGTLKLSVDTSGAMRVNQLSGDETTLLTVDENGVFGRLPGGAADPITCGTGIIPWKLGGNNVSGVLNSNLIGPCNNYDFILQANGKKSLFIKTNGHVGIGENNSNPSAILDIKDPSSSDRLQFIGGGFGFIESSGDVTWLYGGDFSIAQGSTGLYNYRFAVTSAGNVVVHNRLGIGVASPAAKLDVLESSPLGGTVGNIRLLSSISGSVNTNTFKHNEWLLRDNSAASWTGASLHDGISIDGSFVTPGSDTKTWWQRQPNADKQSWGNGSATYMALEQGNLYIGPGRPKTGGVAQNAKLTVDGMILAKDIRVAISTSTHWADYVFEKDYKLTPLNELEKFVQKNKHLPGVPSESEVKENGVNLVEMNVILLQKIEELYLYNIDLNKRLKSLEEQLQESRTKK